MDTQTLQLSQLRIDGGTQPRVAINEEVVADYAEHLREGVVLPPVVAFFDGVVYWLADGFHRYHAHRRVGREAIAADVHDGGLREAILYSVGANAEHGLRRTNDDKRKAVETMLIHEIASKDENGNPWCDSDIARQCRVHHTTVGRIRKELSCALHKMDTPDRLVKRGNSVYTQNTAKIGKSRPKSLAVPPCPAQSRKACAPEDCLTLDIPRNPKSAARTLLGTFGNKVAIAIAEHVLLMATDPQAAQSQCEPVL